MSGTPAIDEALARLRGKSGRAFWRGLDQLFGQDAFRKRIAAEFPGLAAEAGGWQRRDLLKCLGGALALAGLDGCERVPDQRALPYVRTPEGAEPGVPRYYATAVELEGIAQPVIGTTRDGRPVKLEGNPGHPASGGATDAFTQAALLGLYDPSRSAAPRGGAGIADWGAWDRMVAAERARCDANGGSGFRLLTGPAGSPTLLRQVLALLARWPEARWHVFSATGVAAPVVELLQLDRAEAIVCLDADPLGSGPLQTFQARGWSARRRAYQAGQGTAALLVAEPAPTLTGAAATERLVAAPGRIGALLAGIGSRFEIGTAPALAAEEQAWVDRAADLLGRHRGRGLLLVGDDDALRPLALAIEARLGNLGQTRIALAAPAGAPVAGGITSLARDLRAGAVQTLFVLDANPAYAAPAELGFGAAMGHARLRLHAGLHDDETGRLCQWHAPLTHDLESWSDGRAADGSAVLVQPLVRPWLDVRSRHALLDGLTGGQGKDHELVRATWVETLGAGFEGQWQGALVSGRIAGSDLPAVAYDRPVATGPAPVPGSEWLTLIFRPDPSVWDGRFASNPWLQELPRPLTKMVWGNAIHISPALARARGLENGDRVRLSARGRSLAGPVWILPGLAANCLLVHLGYGRGAGGPVAQGVGFDAFPLRTSDAQWHLQGVVLERAEGREALAATQEDFAIEAHDPVRFVAAPREALPSEPAHESFYPPQPRQSPSWGMSIDLDLCIGCNACVSACVAENNIAMVGKEQVANGRIMHWLRIDLYHEGPPDAPGHAFQPVPCMHCEDAPCEMGCPVEATVHSPDGLNLQLYNRCIGTRTCSAYCPYKVRRFNWFDFTGDDPPELRAARNPEVTVRGRGVMEKCTYCIQRIETVRIAADRDGRAIAEGEVKTACQQACPTQAITFGNIADPASAVSRRKAEGRDYSLLPEAQTRPRTTYAARIVRGEGEG